ncbi:MAG: N-acetyltransferase family protein [Limisphaerales bacterium]
MEPVLVRPARRDDCPAILAIYNEAVLTTTASYDVEPWTLERRLEWFDDHTTSGFGIFIAEEGNRAVGWSSLSRFHNRHAYRHTAEVSVYVAGNRRGLGIGTLLLPPLLESARARNLHTLIAAIDGSNEASLRLHARFGFQQVGHFREVGHKFGRWLDVVYLQRFLAPTSASSGLDSPRTEA